MSLFSKIFGTHSQHEVKRILPIVDKIEALAPEFEKMTDEELQAKTPEFKERLANGETLDDILPEAYATVREAATRVLGMRHYHVQLIGGVILHQGRITEMRTGEGKTLVSTLPAYLNALEGKGVHIVTVNDYLAKRDAEWMGKVHEFLGLTVGVILNNLDNDERRAAYNCDITYATNNELGFDYLRDNMVVYKEELVQRELHYAIIDEVDSVLIDEARTPLIISGQSGKSTKLYEACDIFVKQLTRGTAKELSKMDILMNDDSNGLDAAAALKAAFPQVKIIAITSMAESSWLKRAREIGIESFWYKEVSQETILEVMDRTMAGEFVYPDHPPTVHLGLSSNTEFTTRELEVLRVMTKGLSNSAIAQKLGISENTVKVHIQHMLDKTGYKNRTELAIEARVSGVAISID